MYEQARGICGVRVDLFGDLPPRPKQPAVLPLDHPAVKLAGEFMASIAARYETGEIEDPAALKLIRDAELPIFLAKHGRMQGK